MSTEANQGAAVEASSVAVKLPEFWKSDPAMWFAQAESQFALANVTKDVTKFHHIVSKVDQSIICHIADLVQAPPENEKYKAVKDRLIARFALSPEARMERLLGSSDLGDLRPTHLLAKMQEMATGLGITEQMLKMLFLQRMPAQIRTILTISDGTLSKLAEMADKMTELPQTSAVAASSSTASEDRLEKLQEQLEVLSMEFRRFRANPDQKRSRSSSRSRAPSVGRELCWYHKKYGHEAQRCKQPCSFNVTKN